MKTIHAKFLCPMHMILPYTLKFNRLFIIVTIAIYRYLHYSFTDAVRSQDTLYVLRSVSSNIYGRSITWNFLRNNWRTLKDRYMHSYVYVRTRAVRLTRLCN